MVFVEFRLRGYISRDFIVELETTACLVVQSLHIEKVETTSLLQMLNTTQNFSDLCGEDLNPEEREAVLVYR